MKNKLKASQTIVLFTSNVEGGIVQFTLKIAQVLVEDGYKVSVFAPVAITKRIFDDDLVYEVYEKKKSILRSSQISGDVVSKISAIKPAAVLFCDNGIFSLQTLLSLKKTAFPTSIFIHDILPHLEKFNLYEKLKQRLKNRLLRETLERVDQVILLSKNSFDLFGEKYSRYSEKALWIPLGAHIPEAKALAPKEIEVMEEEKYFLFFGRISKYKGIENLLDAYKGLKSQNKPFLVIAGGGDFTKNEKKLINDNKDVIVINRYLKDGEMIYLIKNAIAVVLPYIEASQSGVIPIAYHFAIPVITSNVPGLTEYVVDGESGIICSDKAAIKQAMLAMENKEFYNHLKKGANKFYQENLNWGTNLSRIIKNKSDSVK